MRGCAWADRGERNSCPPYSQFGSHRSLFEMTLGIVGFGRIGAEVARLAAPMFSAVQLFWR